MCVMEYQVWYIQLLENVTQNMKCILLICFYISLPIILIALYSCLPLQSITC